MASWRSDASEVAQADLDSLLDLVLGFAEQQLGTHGEFFPYAAAVDMNGDQRLVAGLPDESERPESTDVLDVIWRGLMRQTETNRAAAVVADVRLPESGTDAVRVELEHAEGQAMTVLLPYRKKRFSKAVEFGEMSAQPGERRIWA